MRQNRHQPLRDLGLIAGAVLDAVLSRVDPVQEAIDQRPPMAQRARAAGRRRASPTTSCTQGSCPSAAAPRGLGSQPGAWNEGPARLRIAVP